MVVTGLGATGSTEQQVNCDGLRIFIVHPNELVRCGLMAMMSGLDGVDRVEDFAEPDAALRRLDSTAVDVLVIPCVNAGGFSRLSAVGRDRCVKTLSLMEGSEDQHFATASEISADGFLMAAELTAESLDDTLTRLHRGEMPIPDPLARWMLDRLRGGRQRHRPSQPYMLTPRERQTLELLAQGLSNKQIAKRLNISQHGAKRHVANVIAKLNCPNRTLAVALGLREGLIEQPKDQRGGTEQV